MYRYVKDQHNAEGAGLDTRRMGLIASTSWHAADDETPHSHFSRAGGCCMEKSPLLHRETASLSAG
jgi:hypothetical protein